MELPKINEWQVWDDNLKCIKAWYTNSCLDFLEEIYVSNKVVFEYGMGYSTIWWSKKCEGVYSVESNKEWYDSILNHFLEEGFWNLKYISFEVNETNYVNNIFKYGIKFDIVVIDGIYREKCVEPALQCLTKKDGLLIYDNWMQPSVEVQSEETQKLLLGHEHEIFKQKDHPDWQTLVVYKT